MYDPFIFGHSLPKTKARILGFGNVRVWNTELVTEFTGDQLEMINKTVVEAITGAIMAMIAELTRDDQRDGHGDHLRVDPGDDPRIDR